LPKKQHVERPGIIETRVSSDHADPSPVLADHPARRVDEVPRQAQPGRTNPAVADLEVALGQDPSLPFPSSTVATQRAPLSSWKMPPSPDPLLPGTPPRP
jgi:hypothetical protein